MTLACNTQLRADRNERSSWCERNTSMSVKLKIGAWYERCEFFFLSFLLPPISISHPSPHQYLYTMYLFIHLSVIYRAIYQPIDLSIYLSISLSIHLSIALSICLSIYLSIYLSSYLAID